MHLTWTAWQTIVGGMTLLVVLLGIGWRGYKTLKNQNDTAEALARRIKREVLGEDDDDPNAPHGPSIRVLIGQVIDQTRPLVSTVEEHGRRLGKHDEELSDHAGRLGRLETAVARTLGGSASTPPD